MNTIIEMENVVKKIKNKVVVDNVSLKMKSGKIYGLKGVNGSGKTMLIRLICGLIIPSEGYIEINGEKLGKNLQFPKSIGVLIENPVFLDNYSGFDNLKILASIKDEIGDDGIRDAIVRVGLKPDRKKYKKYSLGMKQRLGIAAAIMEHPDIIVLDEPTNALDAGGVEMVKRLLIEEKNRGALIIIACHDSQVLNWLADEIIYIENGKVISDLSLA